MRTRLLTVAVLLTVLLTLQRPLPTSAAAGDISGGLASGGGVSLIVWGGGPPSALATAAASKGCTLNAAWVSSGGGFTGYVFGAPAIVNNAFLALFPDQIPASTAILAVCRGAAPAAAPAPATSSVNADVQLARLIFAGLNAQRTQRGLPALTESGILDTAAKYAPVVQANVDLNHELGGQEPWDRATAQGYPTMNVGEILAARIFSGPYDIPTEANNFVQQWMNSPPHRDIILGVTLNATEMGTGCAHGVDSSGRTTLYCVGMTGQP